jgi:GDPmannose 4,6-dehydratase
MKRRCALITGITGQDGAYLAAYLLMKGYVVHGIVRRSSLSNTGRIDSLIKQFGGNQLFLHGGDVTDAIGLLHVISRVRPDEIYNLAAQSHVAVSFESPEYTAQADALGALRLLEAIRLAGLADSVRFYQASTSELFGLSAPPQSEKTPFYPRSPYGAAKLYAYTITVNYREAYGMFAANGILFNHESPLRGDHFVTRKITKAVARIARGSQEVLMLGNLDAQRDWGYAPEYVDAMWRMMDHRSPDDFVIATGEMHTVRAFVEKAFAVIGRDILWDGCGTDAVGYDAVTGRKYVAIDPGLYRPAEVHALCGDPAKASHELGWKAIVRCERLVEIMVENDIAVLMGAPYSPLNTMGAFFPFRALDDRYALCNS